MRLLLFVCVLVVSILAKQCKPKAHAAPRLIGNDIDDPVESTRVLRKPLQKVYLWPSLTDPEKKVIRDAFFQIGRRTCIRFEEQEYKPWYHADRWNSDAPYVLIRKSKKYAAYSDNTVEGLVDRTVLYITEGALHSSQGHNQSRGAVMDQLVRYMGIKRELLRPDAPSYIQPIAQIPSVKPPPFDPVQLQWPFDPESISVPLWAREKYRLTQYCPARNDQDIGAGQRVGLLTKWDTVKLNAMYCPNMIKPGVDPRRGPCVVPRSKDSEEFRRKVFAYKKLLNRNHHN